jgi:hypothetical protein
MQYSLSQSLPCTSFREENEKHTFQKIDIDILQKTQEYKYFYFFLKDAAILENMRAKNKDIEPTKYIEITHKSNSLSAHDTLLFARFSKELKIIAQSFIP